MRLFQFRRAPEPRGAPPPPQGPPAGAPHPHGPASDRDDRDGDDMHEPLAKTLGQSLGLNPLQGHPKYQKIRDLDKGTFGFVQLAVDTQSGEQVAIKFIERGQEVSKYVEREIINHKRLIHPHIVQLKEVFLTQQYLAIAMEYAAGGNLYQMVAKSGGLPEADARWYFQQLIFAIDYCHKLGVANRDVKLENTLLVSSARPLIKICDFGYSKDEKFQSAPGSKVGTPAYLAPEVISASRGVTYDGMAADVWSCGVMLYVMISAQYPFGRAEDQGLKTARQMHVMLQRILKVEYAMPANKAVSPELQDLLARILVAKPAERMTMAEIQRHPWFVKDLPDGVAMMNEELLTQQGRAAHPAPPPPPAVPAPAVVAGNGGAARPPPARAAHSGPAAPRVAPKPAPAPEAARAATRIEREMSTPASAPRAGAKEAAPAAQRGAGKEVNEAVEAAKAEDTDEAPAKRTAKSKETAIAAPALRGRSPSPASSKKPAAEKA